MSDLNFTPEVTKEILRDETGADYERIELAYLALKASGQLIIQKVKGDYGVYLISNKTRWIMEPCAKLSDAIGSLFLTLQDKGIVKDKTVNMLGWKVKDDYR